MVNRYIPKNYKIINKAISEESKDIVIKELIGNTKNEDYYLLSELIDCFSVHEDTRGLYTVLYFFLDKIIIHNKKTISKFNKNEWLNEAIKVEERVLTKLISYKNAEDDTDNRLIKIFYKNKDTYFYQNFYPKLHESIINIYNQKNPFDISDDDFEDRIGQVYTVLNAACATVTNESFLSNTTEEKFKYFIQNKISSKGTQDNPYIKESTADHYSGIVFQVWTKNYFLSEIARRKEYKRQNQEYTRSKSDIKQEYFPTDHPYVKKYNQSVRDDIELDKEDQIETLKESEDSHENKTDQADNGDDEDNLYNKNHYLSLKDNVPSIDRYEVLKINQLHRIYKYFESQKNSKDLNQHTFKLMFYTMLFLRRSPTFLTKITYNQQRDKNKKLKSAIENYPLLEINDAMIYYKPSHLFNPIKEDYESYEENHFLKSRKLFDSWDDILPFYNNAHFIAGIPLPPFLLKMINEYDILKSKMNIKSDHLFIWQEKNTFTHELDKTKFNDRQKTLFDELNIEQYLYENIYRSFDGYMKEFGLGLVDAYLISERHRIPQEIALRYTSISLKDLANNYYKASEKWFDAIRNNYINYDFQSDTHAWKTDKFPHILMGSWRALKPEYCRKIQDYLNSPSFLDNPLIQTKTGYQKRNQKVIKAIFHLFMLNGLRPYEITRLKRSWLSINNQTLLVDGKGKENARIIPLHPNLYDELLGLLKYKKEKPDQLFWMYDQKGNPFEIKLSFLESVLNSIINEIYEENTKDLEFDCYAFRHRSHTDFYHLGCPERTLNYLFGHYKNQVYDFTYAFLSDATSKEYFRISDLMVKEYKLYE